MIIPSTSLLQVSAYGGAYTTEFDFTINTRSAEEQVWGTIDEDTTWTNDKTYIVMGNVGVAPGETLTIQAGTTVEFNGNYSLNVGGQLIADGTEDQPIRFVSHDGSLGGASTSTTPASTPWQMQTAITRAVTSCAGWWWRGRRRVLAVILPLPISAT